MSLDSTRKKALLALTVIGYTFLALICVTAHVDSKNSTFPNPSVPCQIPLDESPKEQATYLYEVLKEHDYAQLEIQLRRYVPEFKKMDKEDIEPLDDIVTLALTATNTEVREAFDLMIKGGRRGWGPNTDLELLIFFASKKELKRNELIPLAIALVDGFWLSYGNAEVQEQAKADAFEMLEYGRYVGQWRIDQGYPSLEDQPIFALTCWAWRGPSNQLVSFAPYKLSRYSRRKMDLHAYEWNTTSVDTLKEMKSWMETMDWIEADSGKIASNIEQYFWFDSYHT